MIPGLDSSTDICGTSTVPPSTAFASQTHRKLTYPSAPTLRLLCLVLPSPTHPDIVENHACAQFVGRDILGITILGGHRRGMAVEARVVCYYSTKEFANFVHCRKPIVRAVGQTPAIRNMGDSTCFQHAGIQLLPQHDRCRCRGGERSLVLGQRKCER